MRFTLKFTFINSPGIEYLPQKTIADALLEKENNFDLLRLLAAFLVIFSHSYPITGFGWAEPIGKWTGYRDGGNFAVCIFFAISGFLVTRSLARNSVSAYLAARALRILPGLAVVVLVQTLVVGLIFTTLPAPEYLAHPGTFDGLRSILVFDVRFALPGVFQGHPMDGVVNGSLWTLPIETGFYLLLPLLGLTTLLGSRRLWILLLVLAAARASLQSFGIDETHPGPLAFKGASLYMALDFGLVFTMGAALWVYRDFIPLSGGLAVCALLILFAAAGTQAAPWAFYIAVPYLVIYLALARPVVSPAKYVGDISFGVYLYAFPVQQLLFSLFDRAISPTRLTLCAIPLVVGCALLSWRFVEAPALRLKRRIEAAAARKQLPG